MTTHHTVDFRDLPPDRVRVEGNLSEIEAHHKLLTDHSIVTSAVDEAAKEDLAIFVSLYFYHSTPGPLSSLDKHRVKKLEFSLSESDTRLFDLLIEVVVKRFNIQFLAQQTVVPPCSLVSRYNRPITSRLLWRQWNHNIVAQCMMPRSGTSLSYTRSKYGLLSGQR
jgi:hypothetical protein